MRIADIHTHILPGLDDGAKTLDESLEMLRQEYNNGVRDLVVTPHYVYEERNGKQKVRESLIELKKAMFEEKINVRLYEGNEVMFTADFLDALSKKDFCTINDSQYALIEFPPTRIKNPVRALDDAYLAGVTPILAHAERYEQFASDIKLFEALIECGIVVQINAHSITDPDSRKSEKFIHKLIKNDLVHIVASDCHDLDRRNITLADAYRIIAKKYGLELAERLFYINPLKVIKNQEIM